MPRPAYGALSAVWSDDDDAAKLIRDYSALASGMARRMERIFYGEDFESAYMESLYYAAFTWKPGKGKFEA